MGAQPDPPPSFAPRGASCLERSSAAVLLTASGIVLAIAIFFASKAVPVDDDIVRAARPAQIGFFNYVFGFVYMHWQGRWTSAGLESAVLPHVDLVHYYWSLLAAVAVTELAAIYVIARYGFRQTTGRSLGMTVIVAAYLWAGIPSTAEAIYWFVGAVENAMDLALAAVVVVTAARAKPNLPTAATLAVAAIVVCGFHELYGLMFCGILATAAVASFSHRSPRRWVWVSILIAALIGLLAVVAAPGNHDRTLTDGGRHGMEFRYAANIFVGEGLHYGKVWLLDPRLIAALVLAACSTTGRETAAGLGWFPWRWVVPAGTVAAAAVGLFIPTFAIGQWLPDRTSSGVWIVFTAGTFLTVKLWTANPDRFDSSRITCLRCAARIALAVMLLTTGNVAAARRDFRTRLTPWHTAVEQRFAVLRERPSRDVSLLPLPPGPHLLRTPELYRKGPPIYNRSWAFCFDQASVMVDPPVDPPRPGR